MKRGGVVLILIILGILSYVFFSIDVRATTYCKTIQQEDGSVIEVNCCEYDSAERDLSQSICEECGHIWGYEACCDDTWDNYCVSDGGSCISGISYNDHCTDGIKNCDETSIDCGGSDCGSCCVFPTQNDECELGCGPDEDYDCCKELFSVNGVVPWSNDRKCCDKTELWCDGSASCTYGVYNTNHCNDNIMNCGEQGVDCGGDCQTCAITSDGVCSYSDLLFFRDNDADCCNLIGGTFSDGRCCYPGGDDWCVKNKGSCLNGVYYNDHCSDGVQNFFCGYYNNQNFYSFSYELNKYMYNLFGFSSEQGIDCGGECGSCRSIVAQGEACELTYDCGDDMYCSTGYCCPYTGFWNGTCCISGQECI